MEEIVRSVTGSIYVYLNTGKTVYDGYEWADVVEKKPNWSYIIEH